MKSFAGFLAKADSQLVVDSDAVLPLFCHPSMLRAVTKRDLQVLQLLCLVQEQDAAGDPLDSQQPQRVLLVEQGRSLSVAEGADLFRLRLLRIV